MTQALAVRYEGSEHSEFLQRYSDSIYKGPLLTRKEFKSLAGLVSPSEYYADVGCFDRWWESRGLRDQFISAFGFALLCREVFDALQAVGGDWVEVGAGSGSWSRGLSTAGLSIIGTDDMDEVWQFRHGAHATLEKLAGYEAVHRYPDRNVLAVWPNYSRIWATRTAEAMTGGRYFALVSEGLGGCVGDDTLFSALEQDFDEVSRVVMPCFMGIHDSLAIYRKKES